MRIRRTEELLAGTGLLDDLNETRLELLDGGNVVGEDTHLTGLGGNVHLNAVLKYQFRTSVGSSASRSQRAQRSHVHILGLVDSLHVEILSASNCFQTGFPFPKGSHVSLQNPASSPLSPISSFHSLLLSNFSSLQPSHTLLFQSPRTYLVRQSQTELNLVGGHISVSTALDGAEGVESRAGGASDTEGVHYGGAVGVRGCVGCGSDGGILVLSSQRAAND